MIYLRLTVTMLLWGGTFVSGRMLSDVFDPIITTFLRMTSASIGALIMFCIVEKKFPKIQSQNLIHMFLLALVGNISFNVFFFKGLHYIHAGRAALIVATTPLFVALFATLLGDKLTRNQILGICLSFVGATFVIANGHPSQIFQGSFGKGEIAITICVLSWSFYTLLSKNVLRLMNPLTAVFYTCAVASLILLIPALKLGLVQSFHDAQLRDWVNIVYMSIGGNLIGGWCYYQGITKIGVSQAAIFMNLVPLFALLSGYLILDETIALPVLFGGILILSGVTLTNLTKNRHKAHVQ